MIDGKLMISKTDYIVCVDDDDFIPRYYTFKILYPNLSMWQIKVRYWISKFKSLFT